MPEWLQNFQKQFSALSPARQATLAITAVGSLAFFAWVASGARQAEYRVLYRGLEDAEVAQVIDGLTAERIDHQLGEGGTAILVPGTRVHEARMRIASRGLPSGSSPGFEIFDQGKFGVTDFVQKVNYHRALQGELARTIEQVEGVEKARVQLAIPERRTLLRKDDRRPTASIVTRLRAGWDLDASQVRGIVHLVASSVEGLDVSQVTLVDNHGRLLAPQADMDFAGRGAGPVLGAQRRLEKQLEEQIESILGRTVGLGRIVAKVSAELDWTQTEQTQELYDPDGQVARSTQIDSETSSDSVREGGVAGIAANTPDVEPAEGPSATGSASERTSQTTNYEISKTVSRSVLPSGRIERLSIAVLVDGKPVTAAPPVAGGEGEAEESVAFQPWTAEELVEFEELAKRAVGFDVQRGDEISVINSPFIEIDTEGAPAGFLTPDVMVLLDTVLQIALLLLGLFAFSRLFVRPLAEAVGGGDTAALEGLREEVLERLAAVEVDQPQPVVGPDGITLEDADIPGLVAESDEMTLQQQVDRLAQVRADDSVRTIRGWMATGG
ncbi:MAG: flagellar basal-body MS-ring/collar protein FliF [Myxococcota bacterium]